VARAAPRGRPLTLLRTRLPRSDTAGGFLQDDRPAGEVIWHGPQVAAARGDFRAAAN